MLLASDEAGRGRPDFFEGGDGLARDLDAGQTVVIPGAGHLAPLEHPAVFCPLRPLARPSLPT
ncbi:hypothetical protein ACFZCY_05380 [Streptomyces sp. NPDC007983]|uniref:hypothetical protein n=1 Tax=Streptomyces sp. NPDC007983 TaxID=3364800 RepID=UPI0036E409E7